MYCLASTYFDWASKNHYMTLEEPINQCKVFEAECTIHKIMTMTNNPYQLIMTMGYTKHGIPKPLRWLENSK